MKYFIYKSSHVFVHLLKNPINPLDRLSYSKHPTAGSSWSCYGSQAKENINWRPYSGIAYRDFSFDIMLMKRSNMGAVGWALAQLKGSGFSKNKYLTLTLRSTNHVNLTACWQKTNQMLADLQSIIWKPCHLFIDNGQNNNTVCIICIPKPTMYLYLCSQSDYYWRVEAICQPYLGWYLL